MRRVSDFGDGDPCPGDEERPQHAKHGNMMVLPSKHQYCPHSDHNRKGQETNNLFEWDGVTPARRSEPSL
jgi:hypothetical protein